MHLDIVDNVCDDDAEVYKPILTSISRSSIVCCLGQKIPGTYLRNIFLLFEFPQLEGVRTGVVRLVWSGSWKYNLFLLLST